MDDSRTPQHPRTDENSDGLTAPGYALSGKIMLSAIVILFAVVVFMVCLHVYARWYLTQARQRHRRRRNGRRTHLVFYAEPNNPNSSSNAARGLDAAVLSRLPALLYSAKTHTGVLECAVCLSEFEEKDKIRVLPKCNHSFHMDCVDMWFHSHSTCPLCRSPVEPVLETRDFVVSVGEPSATEPDLPCSSSGFCATCQHGGHCPPPPSSSLGDRRKAFELERVTIQVPRTNESQDECGPSQGLKSPAASRLMSLKRILSMNRRGAASPVSPSAGVGTSRGVATSELDIECGRDESSTQ